MKVMVVKNKTQREKALSRLLKKRKADVVIFEEKNGENSTN